MERTLDELLRHPALWRAGDAARDARGHARTEPIPTGFPELDACLPGGGWPAGALVELLHPQPGIGELSLLLPALARLSRSGRWLAWIAPPYRACVPALQAGGVDPRRVLVVRCRDHGEALWAAEQALRSGACAAVLLWPRGGARHSPAAAPRERATGARELRRLQLAAAAGGSLGLVFRPAQLARESSPAALRLLLAAAGDALQVEVVKCRGGRPARLRLRLAAPGRGRGGVP